MGGRAGTLVRQRDLRLARAGQRRTRARRRGALAAARGVAGEPAAVCRFPSAPRRRRCASSSCSAENAQSSVSSAPHRRRRDRRARPGRGSCDVHGLERRSLLLRLSREAAHLLQPLALCGRPCARSRRSRVGAARPRFSPAPAATYEFALHRVGARVGRMRAGAARRVGRPRRRHARTFCGFTRHPVVFRHLVLLDVHRRGLLRTFPSCCPTPTITLSRRRLLHGVARRAASEASIRKRGGRLAVHGEIARLASALCLRSEIKVVFVGPSAPSHAALARNFALQRLAAPLMRDVADAADLRTPRAPRHPTFAEVASAHRHPLTPHRPLPQPPPCRTRSRPARPPWARSSSRSSSTACRSRRRTSSTWRSRASTTGSTSTA